MLQSRDLTVIFMELVDRVVILQKETKKGTISVDEINFELACIRRMMSVNLKYATSPLPLLNLIRDLVDEYHSFLKNAYGSQHISKEVFRINLEDISKMLESCNSLPRSFIYELVTRLGKS